ncbi:MAG: hypothetical protein MUE91_14210, partial [Ignavibacteriaceae bacterium]|nr:hypothetical protein [Ignavibacteriaceae bacterium]
MKKYLLQIRIIIYLILAAIPATANAQFMFSAGATVGGGFIQSNSPSVGTVTTSLFIETNTVLFSEVFPRLSFIFAKDFNAIIPNVEKPYFPWV